MLCSFILLIFFPIFLQQALSKSNAAGLSAAKLTRRRITQEFRDVKGQGLSLHDHPFNSTEDEIGVRLHPSGNLFEWHFSFLGAPDSIYKDGIYHGRIILPRDYPRSAPQIALCTPNGRWEVNKFICLSATAFHQETWDMSWNLRTLVMALRSHMLTKPLEIGGISTSIERRAALATASREWTCPLCRVSHSDLLDPNYGLKEMYGRSGSDNLAESQLNLVKERKLATRQVTKQVRRQILAAKAMERARKRKFYYNLAMLMCSFFVSKLINSLGGKSFISFSFSF